LHLSLLPRQHARQPPRILEPGGGQHRVHVPYQHDFIIGHRLDLRERLRETEVIDAWSKIIGDFIAAHSAPVALREGILYVRVLQPALHYELEQISKPEILRKLKQRFGSKAIRDVRFRIG
jgi:Dna[CI] antecedent DciA-like protein